MDDDNPVDSNNTTSVCGKKVLGAKDVSTSSNESESGSADLPHACTNETTTVVCFPSFQDTDNEQLSTFAAEIQTTNNYPLLRLIAIVVMKERSILLL